MTCSCETVLGDIHMTPCLCGPRTSADSWLVILNPTPYRTRKAVERHQQTAQHSQWAESQYGKCTDEEKERAAA